MKPNWKLRSISVFIIALLGFQVFENSIYLFTIATRQAHPARDVPTALKEIAPLAQRYGISSLWLVFTNDLSVVTEPAEDAPANGNPISRFFGYDPRYAGAWKAMNPQTPIRVRTWKIPSPDADSKSVVYPDFHVEEVLVR